jgi:hypothetical protein
VLSEDERIELTRLVRSKLISIRLVQRARIVLLVAAGKQNKAVAAQLSLGRMSVARWRERYAQHRLAAYRVRPPAVVCPIKDRRSPAGGTDYAKQAGGSHPLEYALEGR